MNQSDKPRAIGTLLSELFQQRNWQRRLGLHAVFQFWDEVVGREIASRARPELIRGTTLWVLVSNSVWMQQLHLQKAMLLEAINRRLGEEKLTDLRFRLDPEAGRRQEEPSAAPPPPPAVVVDNQRLRQLESMLEALPDEELRRSLRRLWIKTETHRR